MLSIIIPSRDCPFLVNTVNDILKNTAGDVEILVSLDWSKPVKTVQDPRVTYTFVQKTGMRSGINLGLEMANGEYVMKCDDHCLFAPGFDKALINNMSENQLVVPRRYYLDSRTWTRDDTAHTHDYHYLSFPAPGGYGKGTFPLTWLEKTKERFNDPRYEIDDLMTFQGSCWLANRKYFMDHVGYLDGSSKTYGQFAGEPLEIGLKYWLGGGEVKLNKKTWYAHLQKNKDYYRNFIGARKYKNSRETIRGHEWSAKHWINNEEPGMKHKFEWLIEKFSPVPGWPEDRSLWKI